MEIAIEMTERRPSQSDLHQPSLHRAHSDGLGRAYWEQAELDLSSPAGLD